MIKDKYEETSINIINTSKILKEEDYIKLNNLKEELNDVFLHSQVFRTRTEMEISVLNDLKHPTADSKYWQSMREQNVMFHELVMLSYEYRKNLVEIKKLDIKIETEKDLLEKELLQIEKEKLNFMILNQERIAQDRIRELHEWHLIKQNLEPQLQYSKKDVDEHQLLSYTKRFINEFITKGMSGSPSENSNLIGQLTSSLNTIKNKGLQDKLLQGLNEETKNFLFQNEMLQSEYK